jgi:hypothetical protein
LTDGSGHTYKTTLYGIPPNLPSALRPAPHSDELPAPERPRSWYLKDDAEMGSNDRQMDVDDMDHYTEYVLPNSEKK